MLEYDESYITVEPICKKCCGAGMACMTCSTDGFTCTECL